MCGIKNDQSSALEAGYSVTSVCPYFELHKSTSQPTNIFP